MWFHSWCYRCYCPHRRLHTCHSARCYAATGRSPLTGRNNKCIVEFWLPRSFLKAYFYNFYLLSIRLLLFAAEYDARSLVRETNWVEKQFCLLNQASFSKAGHVIFLFSSKLFSSKETFLRASLSRSRSERQKTKRRISALLLWTISMGAHRVQRPALLPLLLRPPAAFWSNLHCFFLPNFRFISYSRKTCRRFVTSTQGKLFSLVLFFFSDVKSALKNPI